MLCYFPSYRVLIICILWITFSISIVCAQESNNKRNKTIILNQDSLILDTLSIVPSSFKITLKGLPLDSNIYTLQSEAALLILNNLTQDTVVVTYRVYPINFSKTFFNKSTDLIQSARSTDDPYFYQYGANQNRDPGFGGLHKSGSITRGISFGNNQDLSLSSDLNLQLSGKLTDKIDVLASITDDNIPIQPDGNTQELSDFDQVYIQLSDDKSKLIAGDFQITSEDDYFLKYNKRARGATFSTLVNSEKENGKASFKLQTSGAVSKGKFARNQITGVEGNQGPYRLRGAENETFIVVIAGTERIYIDGRLMERGQEFDYVIDYNAAEIVFTTNQPITKDKRINVEFQYSEKNYARSLLQFKGEMKADNLRMAFNAYGEQDSKNQPLQQELSNEDRLFLSEIGDMLSQAYVPSADSVNFSNSEVLYRMLDSLGYNPVYVYSNDENLAKYRLSFSDLGEAKGNYIQDGFSPNGRIFKWVAPDTLNNELVLNGRFEPVRVLVTPKKSQMLTLDGTYDLRESTQIHFSSALTNTNLNTFSNLDQNDNLGYAGAFNIINVSKLSEDSLNRWNLTQDIKLEFLMDNFNSVERYRSVEFERDWNLSPEAILGVEQYVAGVSLGINNVEKMNAAYSFQTLQTKNDYSGINHQLKTNWKTDAFRVNLIGSFLETSGQNNTEFLRNKIDVAKRIYKSELGYTHEWERNSFFLNTSDSLTGNSYSFLDWQVYFGSLTTATNRFRVFYSQRTDARPLNTKLENANFARQYGMSFQLLRDQKNILKLKVSNRSLEIENEELSLFKPENTLLGRIEYDWRWWNDGLTGNTYYEIGSGLEQKHEFIYLEVPVGQGVYIWNDYNQNGIKELEEFEIAQFSYEANYIRTFLQSNEYEKVYSNQFSQSINIKAASFAKSKSKLPWWGKLNNFSYYRIDRKTNREDRADAFNPFIGNISDSVLVALNGSFRNTLSFQRSHPLWGLDYTINLTRNKQLLTQGFESRQNDFHQIKWRWNLNTKFNLTTQAEIGERKRNSDFIIGRNYLIDYYNVVPKLNYQPNRSYRISMSVEHKEKNNAPQFGGEQSRINQLGFEFSGSEVSKGILQINFNVIQIAYDETSDNSLAFEMLDGLKSGTNYTWGASVQRKLGKNLQLNLNYNGRKPELLNAIHNGGVQVRAFF